MFTCVHSTVHLYLFLYITVNKSKTQIEFIYIFSISLYIDTQSVVDVRLLAKAISRKLNDCVWILLNMEFCDGIYIPIERSSWYKMVEWYFFSGLALADVLSSRVNYDFK